MMKRKLLSIVLSIAVVFSFMPLFTLQANAASDGSKTLVKTKTVTIKPGKTYKTKSFKLPKKMVVQVPVYVTSKKDITKGGFVLSFKDGKKVNAKFKDSLENFGGEDGFDYDNWIYFFMSKKVSKACFKKGKYYVSIKNTTNATIKVKFTVKGYTKYASAAKFSKSKTIDYGSSKAKFKYLDGMYPYVYLGKVGPGLPAISSIKSSNKNVYFEAITKPDGKLYAYIDTDKESASSTISIKLKNRKSPYKIKVKVKH